MTQRAGFCPAFLLAKRVASRFTDELPRVG